MGRRGDRAWSSRKAAARRAAELAGPRYRALREARCALVLPTIAEPFRSRLEDLKRVSHLVLTAVDALEEARGLLERLGGPGNQLPNDEWNELLRRVGRLPANEARAAALAVGRRADRRLSEPWLRAPAQGRAAFLRELQGRAPEWWPSGSLLAYFSIGTGGARGSPWDDPCSSADEFKECANAWRHDVARVFTAGRGVQVARARRVHPSKGVG